jgi:hypothetical protein
MEPHKHVRPKKSHLAALVSCAACWAALGPPDRAAGDVTLVENGRPRASIVIARDSGEKVKTAAGELQSYLEKISGAKLPIVDDSQNPQGAAVLVGKSRLTAGMAISIPAGLTGGRREEGLVIAAKGDRLLLAGNNDGPYHGTEYAVYDFLRGLGVRWYMPGEFGEVVPRCPSIRVPETEIRRWPDFVMRNWWLHATPELAAQEKRWKLRNKMNPDEMFATPGDSSVRTVVAPAAMLKQNPELFALREDGTRDPYLPNLSHPEAVRIAAEAIRRHLRAHPGDHSYGIAPDDGLPRDFNPGTLRLHQGFVSLAGRPGVPGEESITEEWLTFVNRVTAAVRREFPDAYITTNGYANRDLPPQGIVLDDHLVVMFAAIWSCTLHAYDDAHCWQKVRQGEMLRRWCRMCKNVWVYGYNYNMLVSGLTPLPEITKLRRDFPLLKRWGVMGFWDESRNVWAEAGIASRYLRAQLEWDADADADAILDDFFTRWYGRAAAPMKAFWLALDAAVTKTPMHGHEDRILPEVYTPALLAELRRHVARGQETADSRRARLHVRADALICEHLGAYMAMGAAEAAGSFAAAAQHAGRMLALRRELHAVDPFFIWPDENGYHAGVWYWTITERRKFYEALAAKVSGGAGTLVALLPEKADFRIDPHGDGLFAGWYAASADPPGWKKLLTTRPFYRQGFDDREGHPYVGQLWYRLRAEVPETARGKKVFLYVPAVVAEAWCWVNGRYVGHQPYREAYLRPAAMELDVTGALRPGEQNVVAIRVDTGLAPAQAAEGMQSRVFLYSPR